MVLDTRQLSVPIAMYLMQCLDCTTSFTCSVKVATVVLIQSRISFLALSFGSCFWARARPSLENIFVFVSFSHTLKRSICRSTAFLASRSELLSFISEPPNLTASFLVGTLSTFCTIHVKELAIQGDDSKVSSVRGNGKCSPCFDSVSISLQFLDFLLQISLILLLKRDLVCLIDLPYEIAILVLGLYADLNSHSSYWIYKVKATSINAYSDRGPRSRRISHFIIFGEIAGSCSQVENRNTRQVIVKAIAYLFPYFIKSLYAFCNLFQRSVYLYLQLSICTHHCFSRSRLQLRTVYSQLPKLH